MLKKGGGIIQVNTIYNFEDIRTLLLEKAVRGSYYLLTDDIYFEEIERDTVISRDVFIEAKKSVKTLGVMKHIIFYMKEEYSTQEMFSFIQVLRLKTNVIVTIFNPKEKECNMLFISNEYDGELINRIKKFLELEVI